MRDEILILLISALLFAAAGKSFMDDTHRIIFNDERVMRARTKRKDDFLSLIH